jgi:hypothetical protein
MEPRFGTRGAVTDSGEITGLDSGTRESLLSLELSEPNLTRLKG